MTMTHDRGPRPEQLLPEEMERMRSIKTEIEELITMLRTAVEQNEIPEINKEPVKQLADRTERELAELFAFGSIEALERLRGRLERQSRPLIMDNQQ